MRNPHPPRRHDRARPRVRSARRFRPAPAPPPQAEDAARAGEHFARGVRLYQEDDFRAALIEFTRAYELAPNYAVLYNIGQAYYQLRDYPSALRTLERYSNEGGDKLAADRRAQIDREIGELRGRVAHVTIATNVEGVDVSLDDAPLGKAPAGEALLVGDGRRKLTVSKPGYLPVTHVVDIAGGDTITVRFDLTPQQGPSLPSTPPEVQKSGSYAPAVVTGVVGVAGIAVGTVFGVLTLQDKHTLDGECTSGKVCPGRAQSDIDAYSRNGTISGIGFGVGAVGLVLGGYFFFHEQSKERSAVQARVAPWLGPGSAGIVGTF